MTTLFASRLGDVSYDQLQDALDRLDLGYLISARAPTTGNFGQNLLLESTSGSYVFRGNPLIEDQFLKEAWAAAAFHRQSTIAVPYPFLIPESIDPFPWSWVLMPMLPGIQLADRDLYEALTFEQRLGVATAMAEAAAVLHVAGWSEPGEWVSEVQGFAPFRPDYATWIAESMREKLDRSLDVSMDDREWFLDLITRAEQVLVNPFEPVLLHGDYSTNNVVTALVDGVWRITGVFDLMSVHVGHRDADLARQFAVYVEEDPVLATTFLAAYDMARGGQDRNFALFSAFVASERMSIWEWAKRTEVAWWSDDIGLRAWIEGYLKHIPQ